MSNSPKGILFYGYKFDEDYFSTHSDEEGEVDFDLPVDLYDVKKAILEHRGVVNPWNDAPEINYYDSVKQAKHNKWREEHKDELDAYGKILRDLDAQLNVDWSVAGSYEYEGQWYLHIDNSTKRSEWGEFIEITPEDLTVGSDWNEKLRNHLEDAGIPIPEEGPKWYLTSLYG